MIYNLINIFLILILLLALKKVSYDAGYEDAKEKYECTLGRCPYDLFPSLGSILLYKAIMEKSDKNE